MSLWYIFKLSCPCGIFKLSCPCGIFKVSSVIIVQGQGQTVNFPQNFFWVIRWYSYKMIIVFNSPVVEKLVLWCSLSCHSYRYITRISFILLADGEVYLSVLWHVLYVCTLSILVLFFKYFSTHFMLAWTVYL